ncbi:iron-sulfur cluster biosynthesis family protein [Companilactobacillus huachuanensis]|uniref:Iron-sulfur cluster biosynthesis family protein n=1 Tax=Companilactobacillus huachuanensis TaxID=2559914 RepID=A0ABW1RLN3_9LACO|nr:iron-sulfur cluster biosynthesis family protein [Companilactobacillus huachuanensis]
MKANFKPEALQYLANKIPSGSFVILTTDDGSNKYSSIGATCELADKFQLIILNHADEQFSIKLENNANYQLSMTAPEKYLVSDEITIGFDHGTLTLRDKSGILDNALAVIDWRNVNPESERDRLNKMVTLGDQIC